MLTINRSILISAPREHVSEYLRDISRLSDYEQKVDHCTVTYPDKGTALAEVSGRYFGLPWRGSFKMSYTRDGGYHSEMLRGRPFKRATGGFQLRTVSGGTWITHEEQYHLPLTFRFLRPVVRRWLARTIEKELGVIKEGAERLHRQRLIEDIEKDVQLDAR
ncbi:MAG: SRPBCC family protein [Elusimicrobia bacterium]|nr:SRPBCC family protein [Elusimicrobiota bacterium]